jgi:hypothetical protein
MNDTLIFIIIAVCLAGCVILGYILQRNLREMNYVQDATYLHAYLSKVVISEKNDKLNRENLSYLLNEFEKLARNNFDRARTSDLWEKFKDKYEDYLPWKADDDFMTFKTLDERLQ